MDSIINAAARALAKGDPLAALDRVALRNDAPGLALRGIAMAQLGELDRARALLRQAAKAFGHKERVARARCICAETEVQLALRDLHVDDTALMAAIDVLEKHGDLANAAHARLTSVRHHLLLGRVEAAQVALTRVDRASATPVVRAIAELVAADVALRRIRPGHARAALTAAKSAAVDSGVGPLVAEVDGLLRQLDKPAARLVRAGEERLASLDEIEALRRTSGVIVDACRRVVRAGSESCALTTRPVLFAIAETLGRAFPGDCAREDLMRAAFEVKRTNDSHRVRLRVEVGRLRKLIASMARVDATSTGFRMTPVAGNDIVLVLPPVDGPDARLVALLSDGASWSTSSLALAMGASQRTVQRALNRLAEQKLARSIGRARARRWLAPPISEYTTALLLPGAGAPR